MIDNRAQNLVIKCLTRDARRYRMDGNLSTVKKYFAQSDTPLTTALLSAPAGVVMDTVLLPRAKRVLLKLEKCGTNLLQDKYLNRAKSWTRYGFSTLKLESKTRCPKKIMRVSGHVCARFVPHILSEMFCHFSNLEHSG